MFLLFLNKYLDVFIKVYPLGNIHSKDYNTTIFRNIIIYFLYKHYKETKSFDVSEIDVFFKIKNHKSLYNKINTVINNITNIKYLLKKRENFGYYYYINFKIYKSMKKLVPININHPYFDIKIMVFEFKDGESPNGKYLIRDSRENIQVYFTGKLDMDIDKNYSFNDDMFFEKISRQNSNELDPLDRKDMYYKICLYAELERIINHCENSYKEFGAEPDLDMPVPNSLQYKEHNNTSLRTGQDPIFYNGKLIKENDINIVD